ncbi:MAG: type I restriction enzyme R subunit [Psychromonas sp.]|jgi:type I restriction enzyme R subunit
MDKANPQGKTIVFCATQEHAGFVRDYINEYAVNKGWTSNPSYCVRITANDGKEGEKT